MKKAAPVLFGLVGPSGSGKTTVAKHLEKKGFHSFSLSSCIKKEAQKLNLSPINKKILQEMGNKMRMQQGPDILAKLALSEVFKVGAEKAVIDGIRNVHEIKYFKKHTRFTLISITADFVARHKRIVRLKGRKWVGDLESFKQIEKRDSSLGGKRVGQQVEECMKYATHVVNNNDSLKKCFKEVDMICSSVTT